MLLQAFRLFHLMAEQTRRFSGTLFARLAVQLSKACAGNVHGRSHALLSATHAGRYIVVSAGSRQVLMAWCLDGRPRPYPGPPAGSGPSSVPGREPDASPWPRHSWLATHLPQQSGVARRSGKPGKPGKHARKSDQRYLALAAFPIGPRPHPKPEHDGSGMPSAPLHMLGAPEGAPGLPGKDVQGCMDAAAVPQSAGTSAKASDVAGGCEANGRNEEAVCKAVGVVAAASDASVTLLRLDVAARRCSVC